MITGSQCSHHFLLTFCLVLLNNPVLLFFMFPHRFFPLLRVLGICKNTDCLPNMLHSCLLCESITKVLFPSPLARKLFTWSNCTLQMWNWDTHLVVFIITGYILQNTLICSFILRKCKGVFEEQGRRTVTVVKNSTYDQFSYLFIKSASLSPVKSAS